MYENFEWRPHRGPAPVAGLSGVPQYHEPSKAWYVRRGPLGAVYAYSIRPVLPVAPWTPSPPATPTYPSGQSICAQCSYQMQQIEIALRTALAQAQTQPNVQAAYATLATGTYNAFVQAQGILAYLRTLPC